MSELCLWYSNKFTTVAINSIFGHFFSYFTSKSIFKHFLPLKYHAKVQKPDVFAYQMSIIQTVTVFVVTIINLHKDAWVLYNMSPHFTFFFCTFLILSSSQSKLPTVKVPMHLGFTWRNKPRQANKENNVAP